MWTIVAVWWPTARGCASLELTEPYSSRADCCTGSSLPVVAVVEAMLVVLLLLRTKGAVKRVIEKKKMEVVMIWMVVRGVREMLMREIVEMMVMVVMRVMWIVVVRGAPHLPGVFPHVRL
jgi:hypothetical protein